MINNTTENPYGQVRVEWDTMMGHWAVWGMATLDDRDAAYKTAARLEKALKKIK